MQNAANRPGHHVLRLHAEHGEVLHQATGWPFSPRKGMTRRRGSAQRLQRMNFAARQLPQPLFTFMRGNLRTLPQMVHHWR